MSSLISLRGGLTSGDVTELQLQNYNNQRPLAAGQCGKVVVEDSDGMPFFLKHCLQCFYLTVLINQINTQLDLCLTCI